MEVKGLAVALLAATVFVSSTQAALTASQAVVQLYLNNPTLDSYGPRQGNNTNYFGVFYVGTPAKQYTGCFDTGSADVWLPLSTCQSTACMSHDTYNPNVSSTYQGTNNTFSVQYATGTVFGTVVRDTMQIGNTVLTNQSFGAASVANTAFLMSSCDGIFGLSLPQLSKLKAMPPFYTMVDRGLVTNNMFSFWFSKNPQEEPAGELVIGGVNASRLVSKATFFTVQSNQYWTLALDGVSINNVLTRLDAQLAIVDTGSTATTLSNHDAGLLHASIPGATYWDEMGLYKISSGCDSIASQPTVSISIGGSLFAVPPELWVIKVGDACVSGFVPGGATSRIVLGVNFLRAWHTQYTYDPDTGNAMIGLAAPAASTAAPTSRTTYFAGRRRLLIPGKEHRDLTEVDANNIFAATIPSLKARMIS